MKPTFLWAAGIGRNCVSTVATADTAVHVTLLSAAACTEPGPMQVILTVVMQLVFPSHQYNDRPTGLWSDHM